MVPIPLFAGWDAFNRPLPDVAAPNVNLSIAGTGEVTTPILAVRKSGERFIIALSGPLTNDHPAEWSLPIRFKCLLPSDA